MKIHNHKRDIVKLLTMSGLSLLFILVPCEIHAQNIAREQFAIPLSKPDRPFKLNMHIEKGMVKVVIHEGKDIEVNVELQPEKIEKSEPMPNQNQNVNTNVNTNVNIHQPFTKQVLTYGGKYISGRESNNTVTINQVGATRTLNMTVKLPRKHTAQAISIDAKGDIFVSDVNSDMEINTSNGSIQLSGISGSVLATTVNGNIIVSFKKVAPKASMAFSTLIGDIDIIFPVTFKADVKVKSDNGAINSDFEVEQDKNHPSASSHSRANSSQGNQPKYRITGNGWVYGKINQGGAEIMLKNMSGNINIRKAK